MCVSLCMSLCVCRAGRDEVINRGREGGREGGRWEREEGGRGPKFPPAVLLTAAGLPVAPLPPPRRSPVFSEVQV